MFADARLLDELASFFQASARESDFGTFEVKLKQSCYSYTMLLVYLFPGPSWEHTVFEAPPREHHTVSRNGNRQAGPGL
jgi:hypothetical protein